MFNAQFKKALSKHLEQILRLEVILNNSKVYEPLDIPEIVNKKQNPCLDTIKMYVSKFSLTDVFMKVDREDFDAIQVSRENIEIGSFNQLLMNYSSQVFMGTFHLGINPLALRIFANINSSEYIGEHPYAFYNWPNWFQDSPENRRYWLYQIFSAYWEISFRKNYDCYISQLIIEKGIHKDLVGLDSDMAAFSILNFYTADILAKPVYSDLSQEHLLFNFNFNSPRNIEAVKYKINRFFHGSVLENEIELAPFINEIVVKSFIEAVDLWEEYTLDVIFKFKESLQNVAEII